MSLVDPIFVPADRPDRVDKAMKLGVDAVIIDLEDAVAPANKPLARKAAAELLRETTPECAVYVRVNGPGEPDLLAADIEGLAPGWPAVDGVVLPKAESADHVRHLAGLVPGKRLVPIVETALGIEHAASIAAATPPGGTLLFGPADLSAELGIVPTADGLELLMARSRVVMACAAAGLARPIDGPWLNLTTRPGSKSPPATPAGSASAARRPSTLASSRPSGRPSPPTPTRWPGPGGSSPPSRRRRAPASGP